MTTRYYHVSAGAIDDGPRTLPKRWRHVSGLDLASTEELVALGWFPEEIVGFDPFDSEMQTRAGPALDIQATKVVATYTVTDKTVSDMRVKRIAQAKVEADRRLGEQYTDLDRIYGGVKAIIAINNGQQVPAPVVAALEWVDALRTKREALITGINGATKAQLKALDVTENSHWVD